MNVSNLLVGIFVFLIETLFITFISLLVILYRYRYKKVNNIDVVIAEMTKNGYKVRNERGRREFSENRGFRVVTAKRFGSVYSLLDNLGYNISDDDMVDSMNGNKRKFLMVAMKDGLTSTFAFAEKRLRLEPEDVKLLESLKLKYDVQEMFIDEVPVTLSLTPIKSEQTRFAIDAAEDADDLFGVSAKKRMARNLLIASITLFMFVMIISFVILVIMTTQGPSFAADLASTRAAAAVVPVSIPG